MKPKVAERMSRILTLTGALSLGILTAGIGRSLSARSMESFGGGSISSNAPVAQPKQLQSKTIRSNSAFSQAQIDYFMEIAMGSEYNQQGAPRIRKWSGEVRIQAFGKPTSEDLRTLRTVISEVNGLTGGAIRMQLVNSNPNVTIHFVPEAQFRRIEPAYIPVNFGFFVTRWNNQDTINRANVLVTTTGVTQKERSHLIREELTQALGLMRDSYRYADSMFYQPWTDTTRFSDLDRALIQMLYLPQIKPGMTTAEVLRTLNSIQANR
ncbi:DUF2927 domain-containing protein [Leptolyngbya sp. NIES-2104]|uniref:DUF2927 domain-containing protein n=1 Tax=Leptolyngbya sp. NIES-2104 TaxID=1552121 RepID=UPI0006EC66E1|nr:DUF2927 domain-containing protein [Leptolyngbya sp. NIES-2104]GAP95196.1 hypothetical protein NIES2104_17160 [Leptolyngbya sp. NIES-2104]